MKRVVFITDQHLCRESRWEETQRVMGWCVTKFAELQPDVIAFGGDLWDRKPTVEEMKATAEWMAELAAIAPVVGVRGNHDAPGIGILDLVKAPHPIHFAEFPEVHDAGGVSFVLLPWPSKSQLLALLGSDVSGEAARQIGVLELQNVLRGLGGMVETHRPTPACFVGHVQLSGARVSTGQPMMPGCDFELGSEDIALANCDAYLLGHVHLPADLTAGGKPCFMGGSFRRTAYGEVEEKSVVVVDFDDAGGVVRTERVAIPCARMFLLTDEWGWDEEAGKHTWLVGWHDAPSRADFAGADVRLRWSVEPDQREAARAAAVRQRDLILADGAADVKLDERVLAAGNARAPEVAAAPTLVAKVRAYWAARGTTPDDARASRLLSIAQSIETEVSL